jgi:hypothetical protein
MNEVQEWSNKVINQTCKELQLPEEIVTAVFKDQWKRARAAVKTCNQIEFSGLGQIYAKKSRVEKQLRYFENLNNVWLRVKETETDPAKAHSLQTKITQMGPLIENLKKRKDKLDSETES